MHLLGNKLATLPKEIGQLRNLEELHLHYNLIITLPKEIGKLQNLYELHLVSNPLSVKERKDSEVSPKMCNILGLVKSGIVW
ncbi:leucine rich repeat protein [Leptospira alexanderi serovar Manhao 3 str. L 60]|uniref:Leucine rich repeat protein n=1 Tax=Leptospira alexanderi serovar Manhao 3 str. L 60 TaxID=1049759 RepID=V6IFZ9_9LEPT|nr:leucine rich repeat protein [Leptospira alexanderi serovar Manhao 3 str. L 60]